MSFGKPFWENTCFFQSAPIGIRSTAGFCDFWVEIDDVDAVCVRCEFDSKLTVGTAIAACETVRSSVDVEIVELSLETGAKFKTRKNHIKHLNHISHIFFYHFSITYDDFAS